MVPVASTAVTTLRAATMSSPRASRSTAPVSSSEPGPITAPIRRRESTGLLA